MSAFTAARRAAAVFALACTAQALTAGAVPGAWAVGPCYHATVDDINGDGRSDVAVGEPGANGGAGAVHVLYGHAGLPATRPTGTALDDQLITQDTPGVPGRAERGDGFGTAVLMTRLNNDGCADLVIGAPGEDDKAGVVRVFYGSPNGLCGKGSWAMTQNSEGVPDRSEPGDRFGAALAAGRVYGGEYVVGAPGETVDGARRAGAAFVIAAPGQTIPGGDRRLRRAWRVRPLPDLARTPYERSHVRGRRGCHRRAAAPEHPRRARYRDGGQPVRRCSVRQSLQACRGRAGGVRRGPRQGRPAPRRPLRR